MILDGKLISKKVREEVLNDVISFSKEYGRNPRLDVILAGNNQASQIYVRNKEKACGEVGIQSKVHVFDSLCSEDSIIETVSYLSKDDEIDGILIQLPLPDGINTQRVLDYTDPNKDVDGLHFINFGLMNSGRQSLIPCTPLGCMRLIEESGVELSGSHAVVIGRSNLVGKPVAQLLLTKNATVSIAHSRTKNLPDLCKSADILIAAVGKAKMVKAEWVKHGAVVIDVGINKDENGKLCGDVDFEQVKENAAAITPVPGGVGPMTIAFLLKNTLQAARSRLGRQ